MSEMTTLTQCYPVRPDLSASVGRASWGKWAASAILGLCSSIKREHLLRQHQAELMALDDRMLKDIGLNRSSVMTGRF